jgi:chromosomal replication initiator protein
LKVCGKVVNFKLTPAPYSSTLMTEKTLWNQVLERLAEKISPRNFKFWLKPTILIKEESNRIEIGCPHLYAKSLIEQRYLPFIKKAVDSIKGEDTKIILTILPNLFEKKPKKEKKLGPLFREQEPIEVLAARTFRLRPDFTFLNFAVSPTNELAYAAAAAVAKSPGKAYNPLFLYGGVGVGKTHLMQAVGHEIFKSHSDLKAIYCMGEEFTNEIITAIQTKTTAKFKEKYRNAKVLLIDDVQFIAGKTTVQEEFFHTFDALQRRGGQIVLTSDKAPSDIDRLENRLRSRFEGGLIIDIQPPDFELRCAILLIKAKQQALPLTLDLAKHIAANIESTRRLEGVLVRIKTESTFKNIPITLELVNQILGKRAQQELLRKKVDPKQVIRAVAEFYKIKISDLKGPVRKKQIVKPRHISWYLLRTELKLTFMEIGEIFGGRDHTTIMHGSEKIANHLSASEELRNEVSLLKQNIF